MNEFDVDNFYNLLIEELEVDNVKDLRRREGECIQLIKPTLDKKHSRNKCETISNR